MYWLAQDVTVPLVVAKQYLLVNCDVVVVAASAWLPIVTPATDTPTASATFVKLARLSVLDDDFPFERVSSETTSRRFVVWLNITLNILFIEKSSSLRYVCLRNN